ncbi:MAG: serine/threonine protein phosphatase [Lachnospiraceae bacterium]|nr:serine/threonine protein phosphatase [Lachnospiraceae bacterium]
MATYVMSDIHGQYDMFMELLDIIEFNENDMLYVLGDVVDRGPNPIKTLKKLMEMPNVICLVGNHELMAIECFDFLMKEITDTSIAELDDKMLENLITWDYNGSQPTIEEFRKLKIEERQDIIDFIKDFRIYEEVTVNNKDYLLVHAGLGNYSPEKEIEDYSLHELLWMRPDYNIKHLDDTYIVTGHTPTQVIDDNPNPGFIYRNKNNIVIDCGAFALGGRLAALCLDTGEEFYSSANKK